MADEKDFSRGSGPEHSNNNDRLTSQQSLITEIKAGDIPHAQMCLYFRTHADTHKQEDFGRLAYAVGTLHSARN